MKAPNLRGVTPAIVTPFHEDGSVDFETLVSYSRWLKSVPGVTGIVVNAHAGEGTSLFEGERKQIIEAIATEIPDLHIVAGISGEGTAVVAHEATIARDAGAHSVLLFPAASWTRFGYQRPAVADRFRAVRAESGLPVILFNWPNTTKATYPLEVLLELCALDGVFAIKDGARDMIRWDVETPVIRQNFAEIQMLTCQDEFLLHSMWESDGALVGYAALIPELMVELLEKAKTHDYDAAKEVYYQMMPITRAVYHRESHMESTMAMKMGLVQRGHLKNAIVRSPLVPLEETAGPGIKAALIAAGVL